MVQHGGAIGVKVQNINALAPFAVSSFHSVEEFVCWSWWVCAVKVDVGGCLIEKDRKCANRIVLPSTCTRGLLRGLLFAPWRLLFVPLGLQRLNPSTVQASRVLRCCVATLSALHLCHLSCTSHVSTCSTTYLPVGVSTHLSGWFAVLQASHPTLHASHASAPSAHHDQVVPSTTRTLCSLGSLQLTFLCLLDSDLVFHQLHLLRNMRCLHVNSGLTSTCLIFVSISTFCMSSGL